MQPTRNQAPRWGPSKKDPNLEKGPFADSIFIGQCRNFERPRGSGFRGSWCRASGFQGFCGSGLQGFRVSGLRLLGFRVPTLPPRFQGKGSKENNSNSNRSDSYNLKWRSAAAQGYG